jgi:hypothetical protein
MRRATDQEPLLPTAQVWGLLLFVDVLKLNVQWMVVVCAALSMQGANLVGKQ